MNKAVLVFRALGISVGVASLLRLATMAGGVQFETAFQAFLDRFDDLFELGILIEPTERFVVQPFLELLRSFHLPLPDLAPHWRPMFSLAGLLFVSAAHGFAAGETSTVRALSIYAWSALVTLIAGVSSGLAPMGSYVLFFWPLWIFLCWVVGLWFLDAFRTPGGNIVMLLASFFFIASIAFTVLHLREFGLLNFGLQTPGIVLWSLFLVWFGFGAVGLGGLMQAEGQPKARAITDVGLNILFVMGLAFAIGYVMMR